jgi:hypothetical protein
MTRLKITDAIAALIRLGNEESGQVREALMGSSELQTAVPLLQSLAPSPSDVAQQLAPLSINQHAALARGLILVEEACRMRHGSVDVAIAVYSSFALKFPAAADELAEWMLAHSTNDWVPFGHLRGRASSLSEYRRHRERQLSVKAENARAEHDRAAIKKAKEAARKRVAPYRDRIQRAAAEARRDLIDEVSRLSAGERLEHLAWDDSHPLSYYPASLAQSAEEAWWVISDEARQALLAKAATIPSGEWRAWWRDHKSV